MSRWVIGGLVLLTVFNIGLLGWQVLKIKRSGVPWRKVFAMLPVPMLGIAGSYGVYAFNTLFVPPLVAALMAAAYETVYIGLPALDNLTPEQQKLASKIAAWSGWVSFTQNALAGFLFTSIGARVYERITNDWLLWDAAIVMLFLSALHGAQVWINYHAARLTFHRNSIEAQPASQPATNVKLARRPVMRRSATPLQLPARLAMPVISNTAEPMPESVNANAKSAPNRKEIKTREYDPALVDEWMRLNDSKVSYRDIEKMNPSWPSHVTISKLVSARRVELAKARQPAAQPQQPAPAFTLDDLLSAVSLDRSSAKRVFMETGFTDSELAHAGLVRVGRLPQGMDRQTFNSLYAELMN